ncbi:MULTISPECIES: S-layer homology domain-containing protein [unclassified Coleofasciculus]|uniref:S-layer homology domain-containing protein n=1 Tax=unclassified Coleofasciculus TaxID=2692782 RepID=UPI00187F453E|nr:MULTISPECIES: S-layer homology domain-containing protein [unclassified Coleofasciculus]MBE9124668.1 S-layer homology domain-containing protein [Coleofasciculus sp. LEGE 07081]MBE9146995.1 S-layer homology domain-containing protein [Coleofasciculus sp. LEGE 07092]
MRNLPPSDPNSSRLGLDEWIAIIVAFTTIGTILIGTLMYRDRGFNLRRWIGSAPDSTSEAVKEATPLPLPEETPVRQPRVRVRQTPASPSTLLPPEQPLPTEEPEQARILPLVPVPLTPRAETPATPTETPAETVNFTDVPEEFWASSYIAALVRRDIMSGYTDGTFRPNSTINRAEFAALLRKAFDQEPTLQTPNFQDITSDFWGWSAIQETTKTNFLRGYPDKTFRPEQPIPKVQVLVALASGLGLETPSSVPEVLQAYQDAEQIPNYATQKVAAATDAGIVINYPNAQSLNPNQDATRAEVAALIYQALVEAGKAEAIPSEYRVEP